MSGEPRRVGDDRRRICGNLSPSSASPRLSVPTAGRTIARTLQPWRRPLREAFQLLATAFSEHLPDVVPIVEETYLPAHKVDTPAPPDVCPLLASAALISSWLVARATNSPVDSIVCAEEWFAGGVAHGLSEILQEDEIHGAQRLLESLPTGDELDDLLPYLLEAFEGRGMAAVRDRGEAWSAKREKGVFYTPSDVSDYIARQTLVHIGGCSTLHCLDPACGTGVFLRSALDQLERQLMRPRTEICVQNLYGIDISPVAVQSAAFVLLSRCLNGRHHPAETPLEVWRQIRANLISADSTVVGLARVQDVLSEAGTLSDLFPSVTEGFEVVLGNPPYSTLAFDGKHSLRRLRFATAGSGRNSEAYPLFIEMMWRFTKTSLSSAGMVVPLSVAYHTGQQFRSVRREIESVAARWQFQFFDRTPDSLFGDDTKIRNAIIFMFRGPTVERSLFTTDLHRWNSRTRSTLFESLPEVRLQEPRIVAFIPKVGSDLEEYVLRCLLPSRRVLSELWTKSATVDSPESRPTDVFHYSTAYNWLPILRDIPLAQDEKGARVIPDSLKMIRASSIENASFTFGVLSSRISYWFWRVKGDGFHLTRNFLASIPIHRDHVRPGVFDEVCELGDSLWTEMMTNPIVTRNHGTATLNYSPLSAKNLLDRLDLTLVMALGLPREFADYLRSFHERTISAGRMHGLEPAQTGGHYDGAGRQRADQATKHRVERGVERIYQNGLADS